MRRYSDLVNQRQLQAAIEGRKPPYAENDAELYAALTDFEATYASYAEFQDRMEHYWCLRWLLQERVGETTGTVIRDTLVRFDRLPLVVRLPDLPALAGRNARADRDRPHRPRGGHARVPVRGRRGIGSLRCASAHDGDVTGSGAFVDVRATMLRRAEGASGPKCARLR